MHSFCSILIQFWSFQFWRVKNWTKFEGKIFPSHICPKLGSYWQKTCSWCLWDFKFGTQANYLMLKKTLKITFSTGARNIVKMGSEISKYLSWFFHSAKYLMLFWGLCSTRPHYFIHILPPDCLNCNWLFLKFSCCSRLCSTRTQILFKSETAQLVISKYFCLK